MDIVAELKKIPPVTRFLTISLAVVTTSTIVGFVSVYSVLFVRELAFKNLQLWRLYTAFFYGHTGIYLIFDIFTLYRTANDIESKSYSDRSADLAWQTFWACVGIMIATIPLKPYFFFRGFMACLIYLYSALAPEGATTSLMGLVTLPIKYYPYIVILLDLLMGGPRVAAMSVAGSLVGHFWWWTVWGGRLASQGVLAPYSPAPEWLRKQFGETRRPGAGATPSLGGAAAGLAQGGIHVTAPRQPLRTGSSNATATATGASTGTSGYSWGSGRRLGQ